MVLESYKFLCRLRQDPVDPPPSEVEPVPEPLPPFPPLPSLPTDLSIPAEASTFPDQLRALPPLKPLSDANQDED